MAREEAKSLVQSDKNSMEVGPHVRGEPIRVALELPSLGHVTFIGRPLV